MGSASIVREALPEDSLLFTFRSKAQSLPTPVPKAARSIASEPDVSLLFINRTEGPRIHNLEQEVPRSISSEPKDSLLLITIAEAQRLLNTDPEAPRLFIPDMEAYRKSVGEPEASELHLSKATISASDKSVQQEFNILDGEYLK